MNAVYEYYYLYNGHGDVVQIVDKSGKIVNNYKYDEWGNIPENNETISNPFKYAGYIEETDVLIRYSTINILGFKRTRKEVFSRDERICNNLSFTQTNIRYAAAYVALIQDE